jgi:outer membrane protein assembly factor BamB
MNFLYSKHLALPLGLGVALISQTSQCADWAQYRGSNQDGASTEDVLKTWPASPRVVWKTPTPGGFSTFAVTGGQAYTVVIRDGQETCVALNAETGKEVWSYAVGKSKYDGGGESGAPDNRGGDGPRSTPVVDGGHVYVFGAYMNLACLNAKDGSVVWSKDLMTEFGAKMIRWQNAASPLIEGDLVLVNTGVAEGALMAFNKADGKVAWKAGTFNYTHSTPVAATILGVRQVLFITSKGLISVDPAKGTTLWSHPFTWGGSVAASPMVSGDIVYCSAAYQNGSLAVRVSKEGDAFKATELWAKKGNALGSHWTSPVVKDGYVYCIYGQMEFAKAALKCVELATGEIKWSQPGFGPGGLMRVNGNILALNDRGTFVLIEASPDAYKELSRYDALTGKCWNTFALSNGRIYARSTQEGVCLDVSGK